MFEQAQLQKIMEIHNLLDAKSRLELREWLQENHDKETECWVVVKRGRPVDVNTFWYVDAVEEALCFGWIDSTTKKDLRGGDGSKTLSSETSQQLVGTEQGTMPSYGTAGVDDRCGAGRLAGYERIRIFH